MAFLRWRIPARLAILVPCRNPFRPFTFIWFFPRKIVGPLFRDKVNREALHAFLGGISKRLDCPPILIGGVEDHVHLLARFGRTVTQAE